MGKKRKKRTNITVYGCVEGDRERAFISFLEQTYSPRSHNISFQLKPSSGGTPDRIVSLTLNECHRDKCFAWLDEDFEPTESPLSKEVREKLAKCWGVPDADLESFCSCPLSKLQETYNSENKKKPCIIVSQPVCCESLILKVLGHENPCPEYNPEKRNTQISALKNKLNDIMGYKQAIEDQILYYHQNLTVGQLEEKRKEIPELDLLISMLTKQ